MHDSHESRPHCDYPDCSLPARTTPMALRLRGTDASHVVRLCARHLLLFEMEDAEVTAWVDASPALGVAQDVVAV